MSKLNFDIYIGQKMITEQNENIVAVVIPKFFLPKGKFNIGGTPISDNNIHCFKKLYDLGTYIADWIDLFDKTELINATIYLNILSLHKSFKGKAIIDCIDKIIANSNYLELRSFNELN